MNKKIILFILATFMVASLFAKSLEREANELGVQAETKYNNKEYTEAGKIFEQAIAKFNEAVKGWNINFHQLDGGTFHSRIRQVCMPEIQVGHTQLDSYLDQKGFSPKDMWSFIILGKESSMFNFNHQMTQSTSTMLIYSPGHIINAITTSGFEPTYLMMSFPVILLISSCRTTALGKFFENDLTA